MKILLFDTPSRKKLFPITATRAVADIRMGILTMKERWERLTNAEVFILTDHYLAGLYEPFTEGDYILIDASVIPTMQLVQALTKIEQNASLADEIGLIAGRVSIPSALTITDISRLFTETTSFPTIKRLTSLNQLFLWNDEMIRFDYNLVTAKRVSEDHNETVHVTRPSQIFIEEGATIEHSVLNASAGPIYIGKDATVMEGCFIRGPFVLGEGAVLKMGTRIYGATTIGPYCTGGGEIKNCVMMGYSNKGHDGYLGDSVIAEWCNLGAGTSNSNLKNTGGTVRLWNYATDGFTDAGNKCGVIMGDYSRTAINTSINTGTVVGVCANVFGAGLSEKFIPDYKWGPDNGIYYDFDKAVKDVSNWKKMKNKVISEPEIKVLKHIFDHCNHS